ncbi:MAG: type II 3-dehydroquinate dehydratase [Chloroflexi bacterium]|nr:type II 3-dehydroquinate dehydratase [Chloroflexota bacterium]
MAKLLVIHGAGMNMRGKVDVETFGPMTLPEYDEKIAEFGRELEVEVRCYHSNIEGEVANAIYEAHGDGTNAILINPAGWTRDANILVSAMRQVRLPAVEVHMTNPTARGGNSVVLPVCKSSVYGFGIYGYYMAMKGVLETYGL